MIQRKQSLFLLVVFVLSIVGAMLQVGNIEPSGMGVGDNVYSLCILHADGSRGYASFPLLVIYTLNGILSLATIFLFNNRKLQMKLCSVGIAFMAIRYHVFAYLCVSVFPEAGTFHPSFSVCLPVVCLILYVMAHAGINKDEKLVRSMDRIR